MILLGLLSILACKSDIGFDGTLVGNPGRGVASPAENENMRYTTGMGQLRSIEYAQNQSTFNDEDIQEEDLDLAINLLNSRSTFPIRAGNWGGIRMNFDSISITGEGDIAFQLELNDVALTLVSDEAAFSFSDSEAYFVEIGQRNWLTNEQLLDVGEEIIDEEHPLFSEIRGKLANGSGIYIDDDQDGLLSDDEREGSLLASGEERGDHLNSGDNEAEASDGQAD